MDKLKISKILDTLALVAIVVVFALYLFKKPAFTILSVCLILIALLKMGASMLKASYYSDMYNDIKQERDVFEQKIAYLENEINKNSNKE